MPLPDFESLQARSIDRMEMAQSAANANKPDVAQRLSTDAQTHALLSIGAALRELAQAVQQGR
ncbi:hypothetical protein GTX14_04905 [Streptomyces sp. SID4944]|nr:hypothetical protein [Streptomyces sp. SID4944]